MRGNEGSDTMRESETNPAAQEYDMTIRNDSTTHNAKRAFSVTVDGVGQVFASDALGHALEVMRAKGVGANLIYGRKFQAFINHEGKTTPCADCVSFIAAAL